jgi:ubiquinone/menaquinone biosynthesis C-methylase UbiE
LLELHGLDISTSMVELAKETLRDIPVDLRIGDIRKTDYPNQYFDIVTCTGSFYLWDEPENGLAEIHRILKLGGLVLLFETYSNHDARAVRTVIHKNLRGENLLRRVFSPFFLMRQFQMTYTTGEIADIIEKTPFANGFSIEKTTLGGLPAWLRIRLAK